MKLTSDELKSSYRAVTGRLTRTQTPCPTCDLLSQAASSELLESEREQVLDHVAACSDCAEELRLALGTRSSATGGSVIPRRARRFAPWQTGALLAAAAALLLVAGLAVQSRRSASPQQDSPFRQDPQRKGIVSLVPRDTPLPRKAALLRWKGAPENAHYEVMVGTEDLTVLKKAEGLSAPEYLVPPEVLAALPPGARLVWKVVAFAPDGRRVGSPTFVNKLD